MSLKGLINFFNLDGMDEEDEFENYVDDYEEEAPVIPQKNHRKKKEKWVDSADQNPK